MLWRIGMRLPRDGAALRDWTGRSGNLGCFGVSGCRHRRSESGGDALADHGGGELSDVLDNQLEFAVAGIAGHVLVAVIFRLDMDDGCAMRALAFVLGAVIPLVVVARGDFG